MAAAAAWGLGNVAQRKAAPPDSLRFMVWVSALSAPPLLLLSLAGGGRPRAGRPRRRAGSSLGYVAFISTLGGFGVWGWLLRRYDASTVAPYTLLVPVFGMSSAALSPASHSWLQLAAASSAGVLYASPAALVTARTASPGAAARPRSTETRCRRLRRRRQRLGDAAERAASSWAADRNHASYADGGR